MTDYEKYIIARWCYSIGMKIMEDPEYNQLHRTLSVLMPDNEYVNRSWSSDMCPVKLLEKYNLQKYIHAVVLTDKTESIPSINTFHMIQQVLGNYDYSSGATLSYKHDGWNFQAFYFDGRLILFQTRGRSTDAIQLTSIQHLLPQTIPMMGKVTVVMEGTISDANFEVCVKEFGNDSQRGAVSSVIARPEYSHLLDLHAFKIICNEAVTDTFKTLIEWGFKVPMYKEIHSYDELLTTMEEFSSFEPDYASPTDGLVFAGSFTRAIRVLAWEEPIYYSFVLTDELAQDLYFGLPYTEDYGAHRCSVSVRVYPILLPNSTQRQIPGTNWQRIIDNNLKPGKPVAFRIASSAIADLDEESTRLVQLEYQYKELEYRDMIIANEKLKRTHKYYGGA